jgi:hypothetical protein
MSRKMPPHRKHPPESEWRKDWPGTENWTPAPRTHKNYPYHRLEENSGGYVARSAKHYPTGRGSLSGQDFNILGHAGLPGGHAGYGK